MNNLLETTKANVSKDPFLPNVQLLHVSPALDIGNLDTVKSCLPKSSAKKRRNARFHKSHKTLCSIANSSVRQSQGYKVVNTNHLTQNHKNLKRFSRILVCSLWPMKMPLCKREWLFREEWLSGVWIQQPHAFTFHYTTVLEQEPP